MQQSFVGEQGWTAFSGDGDRGLSGMRADRRDRGREHIFGGELHPPQMHGTTADAGQIEQIADGGREPF